MQFPEQLKYTKEHEWLAVDGDAARIGITDYAQDALGDVVYVQLPEVGATVTANGKSLDLNVPGPLKVTSSSITLFGAAFVFGPNELWLTHGKVTFAPGALDPTAWIGHITDLCDVLGF